MTYEQRELKAAKALCERMYGLNWDCTTDFRYQDKCVEMVQIVVEEFGIKDLVKEAIHFGYAAGMVADDSLLEELVSNVLRKTNPQSKS
jgi:hypothetical protein